MPLERVDVSRLQALIDSKGARWRAGTTAVSELSEERKKLLCGALRPKPPGASVRGASETAAKSVGGAAASFDWRDVDGANSHHADQGSGRLRLVRCVRNRRDARRHVSGGARKRIHRD